jgi:hypothetical protein
MPVGAGAQETTDQFDFEDFQYQEGAQAVYGQDPSDPYIPAP